MKENQESVTAKLCAFVRAWHYYKARTKIYEDYLAYKFMGKEEYEDMYHLVESIFSTEKLSSKEVDALLTMYFAPILLPRIHFSETSLMNFASRNGKIQYVILGAGEDTFGFRNENPNIEIFEIDHPSSQKFKLDKIKKMGWQIPENLHFVSVDFSTEESGSMKKKLIQNGFDIEKKTFFSFLGVSYYLELKYFLDTVQQIRDLSASGSELVFDFPFRGKIFPPRVTALSYLTSALGEEMKGGYYKEELKENIHKLDFYIETFYEPADIQKKYFDRRTDSLKAFENVCLVKAVKI